jgi:microcystin-dependent protein
MATVTIVRTTSASQISSLLTQASASATYATKVYVDNQISSLIEAAPSTLDTLNELAAALGDDPNFATTITNLIAEKVTSIPGVINQYAGSGSAAPTGWLFCDGQEVLVTTYQNLYNSLTSNGTIFPYGANTNGSGGAGSTHFRIPNFKGKVPVGKDSSQTEFDVLGESGGSKTSVAPHTHGIDHDHGSFGATSAGEPQEHYHEMHTAANPGSGGPAVRFDYNFDSSGGFGYPQGIYGGGRSSQHTHAITIDVPNFGGTSGAASAAATSGNLQPYITVNYIIKT